MHIVMVSKLKILTLAIAKIENWTILPKVYYGLYRDKFFYVKLKNGINLKLRTNSTDIHAFVNVWLLEEYKHGKNFLKDSDIIIDVGAHVGLFSTYASQFCKKGKIFCFEPIKENYQLLLENVKNNNLDNLYCFNQAVYNNEKIKIFLDEDNAAHSLFGIGSEFVEIQSTSIKKIMDENRIEECNFLKLDCEGSEYEIISSVSDENLKKIKKISLEYHFSDSKPEKLNYLKQKLISAKFELEEYPSSGGMGILIASRIH